MKQYWLKLEAKIDALNLRERAMVFAVAALVLITLVNTAVLDPLLSRQRQLAHQARLDQQQIAAMQATIQQTLASRVANPDAADLEQLKNLRLESTKLRGDLQVLQKGLVSPDKMASLLQDMLGRDGKLRLVSLRKLPALALSGSGDGAANRTANGQAATPAVQPAQRLEADDGAGTVYRHEVEIVVEGGYLDIVSYLSQLERLPWQLFWDSASIKVDSYPNATLTLKLFTLGLDKTWLNI